MTEPECLECARGWAHCHGTWVVHRGDEDPQCSDPDCVTPPEAHLHVMDCEALVPACCA